MRGGRELRRVQRSVARRCLANCTVRARPALVVTPDDLERSIAGDPNRGGDASFDVEGSQLGALERAADLDASRIQTRRLGESEVRSREMQVCITRIAEVAVAIVVDVALVGVSEDRTVVVDLADIVPVLIAAAAGAADAVLARIGLRACRVATGAAFRPVRQGDERAAELRVAAVRLVALRGRAGVRRAGARTEGARTRGSAGAAVVARAALTQRRAGRECVDGS